jgi:dihydroxy-acid dehydratase
MKQLNKYSKAVTQDPTQPAAQAMLHAIGLTKEDFKKPLVGIASTGYEGNPCSTVPEMSVLPMDITTQLKLS